MSFKELGTNTALTILTAFHDSAPERYREEVSKLMRPTYCPCGRLMTETVVHEGGIGYFCEYCNPPTPLPQDR